jgi:hypothetical protein
MIQVASPASIALIERAHLYAPAGWHRRIRSITGWRPAWISR